MFLEGANGKESIPSCLSNYNVDIASLKCEIKLFPSVLKGADQLRHVISIFQNLGDAQRSMFPESLQVLSLLLLLPATNAVSERCFSHLRRLKNYLRNTMTQKRLNHLMLIYTYRDTYKFDAKRICNMFIDDNAERERQFVKFST